MFEILFNVLIIIVIVDNVIKKFIEVVFKVRL